MKQTQVKIRKATEQAKEHQLIGTFSWVGIVALIAIIASLATLPINPSGVEVQTQYQVPAQVPTYAPSLAREAPPNPQGFGVAVLPQVAEFSENLIAMVANPPALFQGLERPQMEGKLEQHQSNLLWLLGMGGKPSELAQELNWWQIVIQGNSAEANLAKTYLGEAILGVEVMARFQELPPEGWVPSAYNPGLTAEAIPVIANAIVALDVMGAPERSLSLKADAIEALKKEAELARAEELARTEELARMQDAEAENGQALALQQELTQAQAQSQDQIQVPDQISSGLTPIMINPSPARMPGIVISPAIALITIRQVWEFWSGKPVGTTLTVVSIQEEAPAIAPVIEEITEDPLRFWYITLRDERVLVDYLMIILWGSRPCAPGDQFEVGNIGLLYKRLQK
jgi:hypothetical protein